MKAKKITIGIVSVIVALILVVLSYLLITNKQYAISTRNMIGATALDDESYIMFADIDDVKFYTFFLHYDYDNIEAFQDNYGAMDIIHYYSNDCSYTGSGTQINCDVVESDKKHLVLHYYGVGVTSEQTSVDVDDTWEIDMTKLWNGEYTKPVLIESI